MFAVLDGHGSDGHHVSNYTKRRLVEEFEIEMALLNNRNKNLKMLNEPSKDLYTFELKSPKDPNRIDSSESESVTMPSIQSKNNLKKHSHKMIKSIEVNQPFLNLEKSSESSRAHTGSSRFK
jgi:serine/threonine protein phosphatase PrpC